MKILKIFIYAIVIFGWVNIIKDYYDSHRCYISGDETTPSCDINEIKSYVAKTHPDWRGYWIKGPVIDGEESK